MKRLRLKQIIAYTNMLAALMLLCHAKANAQFSVGVQAGYANNYLLTNVSNLVSTKYVSQPGFSVAVPLQYDIADWFAIKAQPGYMQKNYQMQRTGFYKGVYETSTNGYVQLPLMGHFSFGSETLRGYVDAGGYAGFWLSGNVGIAVV